MSQYPLQVHPDQQYIPLNSVQVHAQSPDGQSVEAHKEIWLWPVSNTWGTKYVTVSNTWAIKDTVTLYFTNCTLCIGEAGQGQLPGCRELVKLWIGPHRSCSLVSMSHSILHSRTFTFEGKDDNTYILIFMKCLYFLIVPNFQIKTCLTFSSVFPPLSSFQTSPTYPKRTPGIPSAFAALSLRLILWPLSLGLANLNPRNWFRFSNHKKQNLQKAQILTLRPLLGPSSLILPKCL